MPWDGTQLIAARIDADGLSDETVVAGGVAESVLQPEWIGNDRLLYVSDESGFWNLHSYDASGVYCAVPDDAEYGLPMWHLDTRAYVVAGSRHVVAQRIEEGAAELVVADIDQGMTSPLPVDFTGYRSLTRDGLRSSVHCRQTQRCRRGSRTRPRDRHGQAGREPG